MLTTMVPNPGDLLSYGYLGIVELPSHSNLCPSRMISLHCCSFGFWLPNTPIYSWPHTHSIRGATLNLFQKTWVLGSGYWYGHDQRSRVVSVDHHLGTCRILPSLSEVHSKMGVAARGSVRDERRRRRAQEKNTEARQRKHA